MRELTVVAITHQQAPFAVLERVILDHERADAVALALLAAPGVDEAIVLSTCNRTELYLAAAPAVTDAAIDVLATHTGVAARRLHEVAAVHTGVEASRHLFRVASGLESRIVGEGEILAQVRATATRAEGHPAAGPMLRALFRWAAATGRRVRRATDGDAPPSLARSAIDAAGPLLPHDLTVVLGAGAMAAAVTAELSARGLPFRVAARRVERAARLARRPADAVALDDLAPHLRHAALVICATGARTPILTREAVAAARAGAGSPPMRIVDLSMPRNVEPSVGDLEGVGLVGLEHLGAGTGDLHLRRMHEAVAAEHERYETWLAGQSTGRIIAALREQVTAICRHEADRHLAPEEADRFARRLAGKVLHAPTMAIKELAASGDAAALGAVATALGVAAADADPGAPTRAAS